MLTTVLRRYQEYDPDTGRFIPKFRSLRQYAAMLGVNHATLSELYSRDDREPSTMVLQSLVRLFPAAASEIATALAAPEREPVEVA
jgi:hypothetical protein